MGSWIRVTFAAAVLLHPGTAFAQLLSLSPPAPTRWDASGQVGWVSTSKEDVAEEWNDWADAAALSLDVGRYLSPHLKLEGSATLTTDGTVYSYGQLSRPGQPPVFFSREHRFRVAALSAAAHYQFFENRWIHPFLTAGAQIGWERERVLTPPLQFAGRSGRDALPPPEQRRDRIDARPFAGAGAKFYVGERAFLRTDLTAAFDAGGVARVTWRGGVGVDF